MEVNIIDTSQLMEDAGIIEYLAAETFDGYWNGTDGYIDGFKIERP